MIDVELWIEENQGMMVSIAQKFYVSNTRFSFDDLLQEANLAAVKAIGKFDKSRDESKLSTYVYRVVYRACRDYIRKNKDDLYVTICAQRKEWNESQANAENNEVDTPKPKALFATTESPVAVRIDDSQTDAGALANSIPSGSPSGLEYVIKKEQLELLNDALKGLPERERQIIMAHNIDGKTFKSIASDEGITRQGIQQVHKRGMARLKKTLSSKMEEILI